jgi:hypothetical protein
MIATDSTIQRQGGLRLCPAAAVCQGCEPYYVEEAAEKARGYWSSCERLVLDCPMKEWKETLLRSRMQLTATHLMATFVQQQLALDTYGNNLNLQ